MKKVLAIIIAGIFFINNIYAAFSNDFVGTKTAQFLKIGVGARATGMGNAQVAAADDINSIYWNPAGLTKTEKREVSFMHCVWFEDINYDQVSYSQKIATGTFQGTIGCMINYLSMKDIEKRDNIGTNLNETYSPNDLAVTLSYAKIIKNIPMGANVKFIRSQIEEESAIGFAFDVGSQYQLTDQVRLGAVLQNIGTNMKFINESERIAMNFKMGAAYQRMVYNGLLIAALDIDAPEDESIKANLGAEYNCKINETLDVRPRLGLTTGKSDLEDGFNIISSGFGIKYKDYYFDYAWEPFGELGLTHRISMLVKFESIIKKAKPDIKKEEQKEEKTEIIKEEQEKKTEGETAVVEEKKETAALEKAKKEKEKMEKKLEKKREKEKARKTKKEKKPKVKKEKKKKVEKEKKPKVKKIKKKKIKKEKKPKVKKEKEPKTQKEEIPEIENEKQELESKPESEVENKTLEQA